MKLEDTDKIIPVFGIFVSVCIALYSAYVAYDIHARGESPQRNLENTVLGPLDPFAMSFNPNVGLSANVDGTTYDNLQVATILTRNVGLSPILPTDIYENIGIRVDSPYKIVSVYSPDLGSRFIQFTWSKISETLYQAKPVLLNPGDQVQSVALITSSSANSNTKKSPNLTVTGRIVNMPYFSKPYQNLSLGKVAYIWISIYNWELLVFISLFSFTGFLYYFLLERANLIGSSLFSRFLIFMGVASISSASSEATLTYLFGTFTGIFVNYTVSNIFNAPWILLNLAIIIYLYTRQPARKPTIP